MATQDNYIKTAFRIPRDLHAKLLAAAERCGRSMNAEIIDRLQGAFSESNIIDNMTNEQVSFFIVEMEKRLPGIIRGELATAKIKDHVEEPAAVTPQKRIKRTRSPK